jgi:hypothetical protein
VPGEQGKLFWQFNKKVFIMGVFLPGFVIEFIGIVLLIAGLVTNSVPGMIAGACLLAAAIVVHIFRIAGNIRSHRGSAGTGKPGPSAQPEPAGDSAILYSDNLVTITGNAITFKDYSLLLKPRQVNFADIDHIDVLEPSLTTGKYRMWGSGNFTLWFPLDSGRSSRDKIFHAYLRVRGMNVGFTVENSAVVMAILRSKGLIQP